MNSNVDFRSCVFPEDADILPPSDDRMKKTNFITTNNSNQHERGNIIFRQESFEINNCMQSKNRNNQVCDLKSQNN